MNKKTKLELAIGHILQRTFLEKVHKKKSYNLIEKAINLSVNEKYKFGMFESAEKSKVNPTLYLLHMHYSSIEFTEEELLTYYDQKFSVNGSTEGRWVL